MARTRSVNPITFTSESFSALPAELERTLHRLRTYLDDQGRGIDNVRLIKAAIYPLHDEQTPDVIDAELDELARRLMVIRWEENGKRYIAERPEAWDEQQHPQKPKESKCPTPPGYVAVDYRTTRDGEGHSSGSLRDESDTSTRHVRDTSRTDTEAVSPGIGVGEGIGEGTSPDAGASEALRSQRPNTPEATDLLREWVEAETPHRQIAKGSWPGKVAAIRGFLNNGWTVEKLRPILLRCAVISTDAIQLEIGRAQRASPRRDPNANQHRIERIDDEMFGTRSPALEATT